MAGLGGAVPSRCVRQFALLGGVLVVMQLLIFIWFVRNTDMPPHPTPLHQAWPVSPTSTTTTTTTTTSTAIGDTLQSVAVGQRELDDSMIDRHIRSYLSQQPTVPMVTVVVPCYNGQAMVFDAVASILHQSYPAHLIDLIVVNDGSTDPETKFALDSLQQAYQTEQWNLVRAHTCSSMAVCATVQ
jgi:hypothetical protein